MRACRLRSAVALTLLSAAAVVVERFLAAAAVALETGLAALAAVAVGRENSLLVTAARAPPLETAAPPLRWHS